MLNNFFLNKKNKLTYGSLFKLTNYIHIFIKNKVFLGKHIRRVPKSKLILNNIIFQLRIKNLKINEFPKKEKKIT